MARRSTLQMLDVPSVGGLSLIQTGAQQQQQAFNTLDSMLSNYMEGQEQLKNRQQAEALAGLQSNFLANINNPEALQQMLDTGNLGTGFDVLKPENQVKARQALLDTFGKAQVFSDAQIARADANKERTQNDIMQRLISLTDQGAPEAMDALRLYDEAGYLPNAAKARSDLRDLDTARKGRDEKLFVENLVNEAAKVRGTAGAVDFINKAAQEVTSKVAPQNQQAAIDAVMRAGSDALSIPDATKFGVAGQAKAAKEAENLQVADALNREVMVDEELGKRVLNSYGLTRAKTLGDVDAPEVIREVLVENGLRQPGGKFSEKMDNDRLDRGDWVYEAYKEMLKDPDMLLSNVPIEVLTNIVRQVEENRGILEFDRSIKSRVKEGVKEWASSQSNQEIMRNVARIKDRRNDLTKKLDGFYKITNYTVPLNQPTKRDK
jgi:hypothetical protein